MTLSRISSSTRRGELTLVTVMSVGRAASSSIVQPCSMADIAMASSACTPPTPRAAQTMSAHSMCARYAARCRTGTGTSTGSTTMPPCQCSTPSRCVSLRMSRNAAMSPKRRPRSASPTLGAPLTGPKFTTRPPTCRCRPALRACSTNALGAWAAAPRRGPGPSARTGVSSSTSAPARRKISRAAALRISSPASSRTRNAATRIRSTCSAVSTSSGDHGTSSRSQRGQRRPDRSRGAGMSASARVRDDFTHGLTGSDRACGQVVTPSRCLASTSIAPKRGSSRIGSKSESDSSQRSRPASIRDMKSRSSSNAVSRSRS